MLRQHVHLFACAWMERCHSVLIAPSAFVSTHRQARAHAHTRAHTHKPICVEKHHLNVSIGLCIGLYHYYMFLKCVFEYVCSRAYACWCERTPNHSNCKSCFLISNFSLSLSLILSVPLPLSLSLLPSCSLYLASLFHMLTVWLGICWPPGSLNQSRASLTESAHTCPDRNDNDRGQSPHGSVPLPRWSACFGMPMVAYEERRCIQMPVWT